jgi:hypothetical protein
MSQGDFTFTPGGNCNQQTADKLCGFVAQQMTAVQSAQQSIAEQITGITAAQTQVYDTVMQTVVDKIVGVISSAMQCYGSCQQSIQQQIANLTTSPLTQANVALSSVPQPQPQETITQPASQNQQQEVNGAISGLSDYISQLFEINNQTNSTQFLDIIQPIQPVLPKNNIQIIIPQQPETPITVGGGGGQGTQIWVGWCSKFDANAVALLWGVAPPDGTYQIICVMATQQEALDCAQSACPPITGSQQQPNLYTDIGAIPPAITCELAQFSSAVLAAQAVSGFEVAADIADRTVRLRELYEKSVGFPIFGGIIDATVGAAIAGLVGPFNAIEFFTQAVAPIIGNNSQGFQNAVNGLAFVGYMQKEVGVDLGDFAQLYTYSANAQCRRKFLDPDKAIAGWLANSFGDEVLDTHWAIAGYCPEALVWYKNAAKSKPIPDQLAQLRLRGTYSADDYNAGMRHIGYVDQSVIDDLFSLTDYIPSPGEVIAFMQRGSDDQGIIQSLDLENGFTEKYDPGLKYYANARGVSDLQMQQLWAAHWQLPGFGTLSEMYHRNRRNPAYGSGDQQLDTLTKILETGGLLPSQIQPLLGTLYRVVPFRQLIRLSSAGSFTDQQINDLLAANGYSDSDCDLLTKAFHALRLQQLEKSDPIKHWVQFLIDGTECVNQLASIGVSADDAAIVMAASDAGFIKCYLTDLFILGEMDSATLGQRLTAQGVTVSTIDGIIQILSTKVKSTPDYQAYIDGTIERSDAAAAMESYGIDGDRISFMLNSVDRKINQESIAACVSGVKKNFMLGGLTGDNIVPSLLNAGLSLTRSTQLANNWACQRANKNKTVAAATLCGWVSDNRITLLEFIDRMQQVGYTIDDAKNIGVDCLTKINTAAAKKQLQLANQQAKQQLQAERTAKQAAAMAAKQTAAAAKAQQAATKARLRRENQLLNAADYVQKGSTSNLQDAMQTVLAAKSVLENQLGLTQDQTLQVLLDAAERWTGGDVSTYYTLVEDTAALIIQANESFATELPITV